MGVDNGEVRPWATMTTPLDARRRELFALAAPTFRVHGFRGTTVAQLAHACHLSPAGLYHYFASKTEFATYLVRQPHLDWSSVHVGPDVEPRDQLAAFVDLAIRELPTFLVALSLAEELRLPDLDRLRRGLYAEGEAVFGRFIAAANPELAPDQAREAGRTAVAILVGSEALADDATVMRARIRRVLSSYGIALGRGEEPNRSGG